MTDKTCEERLNRMYSEEYSWEQAKDALIYLTNPSRGKHTSEYKLLMAYKKGTLGSMLKRLDSVAFYCAKNDMR